MDESHSEVLTAILAEVRRIGSILEGFENNKKTPTPTLDGWVGPKPKGPAFPSRESRPTQPSKASVIDFCKRIEFCFKMQNEFIDFRTTTNLVEKILDEHGLDCLLDFVNYCEIIYGERGGSIGRPERMEQYFLKWLAGTGRPV